MKTMSLMNKKWLLSLHIVFSAIMLGTSVTFLILSITAVSTQDSVLVLACYKAMHVLSGSSVRASLIGTVVTGVLLSVRTHWGLVKYNWIIVKEILTLIAIVLGPFGMYVWTLKGITLLTDVGIEGVNQGAYVTNTVYLFIGIGLQLLSLLAMFVLSVFKPWGKRKTRNKVGTVVRF
ncbi:hypothetical protein [Paenibacillus qinlingensis]|uniref:Membrane protein n=1 Tax=Paenibacillus qinlingensis TaxID=1837343 RepID=A0ABU1NRE0_9BACL|nr:hypothetical protein [Paenibacillus qinlingensis]MDR6549988.1 putative membrane protein [Paenibacillus qinlingensis]